MKTLKSTILAALGLLLTIATPAEKPESTWFYMNGQGSSYKTNFVLASNLMVLPVHINGSDTLNFVFDTGVGRTIITDLSNPQVVLLNQGRRVRIRGLGPNESIEGTLSSNNALSMGKIYSERQEILVIPNNAIDLSSGMGHKINGIIGRSLFERFVVKISYVNKTVQFFEPERFNRKIRRGEEIIPIELIDGRPYINAQVTINGAVVPVKLLFDTGMSFALWLDPASNSSIKPAEMSRRDVFGQGLNGTVTGEISRVEKFQIGKFEFPNVIAAFPDSGVIHNATISSNRNGSVGADIFRRFNVIVDYQNRQIILRKNSYYKEPFLYDMSGIEVGSIIPGLPFYRVASIGSNTPASECGLEENDEIKSINGQLATNLSMAEITDLLRSKEGRKIRITVKRNGELVKVMLRLRKLV